MDQSSRLTTELNFKNKTILCIAPHPDDEVIGCGAFLLVAAKQNKVVVAYSVSGFSGVSDKYLKQVLNEEDLSSPDRKKEIRRREAEVCCEMLNATAEFWNLPFYENGDKNYSRLDLNVVKKSILKINPDIIFVIDESSDPHGTHGVVQEVCLKLIRKINYQGIVLGYRVWEEYDVLIDDIFVFGFDSMRMEKKEKLLLCYQSQLQEPAFPHDQYDFMELMRIKNRQFGERSAADFEFAEVYRRIIL